MTSAVQILEVEADDAGARLDRWFRRHLPELNHARLEKLLRTGQVRVDGARARAGQRVAEGQKIRVPPTAAGTEPQPRRAPPAVSAADAADLAGRVLYRDDDVLVLNKPAGLAVQGGTRTLRHLDGMLDALTFGAPQRPRLVHRLDRDTSGVLVLARTRRAAAALTQAFRGRDVGKTYWALVAGVPRPAKGTVRVPLQKSGSGRERVHSSPGGDAAVTEYESVARLGRKAAWVVLHPLTGRTHQLRAHMAELGTPIVGDNKYGGASARIGGIPRGLHLHARAVDLPLPGGGRCHVEAPLPPHMAETWTLLGFAAGTTDQGAPAK